MYAYTHTQNSAQIHSYQDCSLLEIYSVELCTFHAVQFLLFILSLFVRYDKPTGIQACRKTENRRKQNDPKKTTYNNNDDDYNNSNSHTSSRALNKAHTHTSVVILRTKILSVPTNKLPSSWHFNVSFSSSKIVRSKRRTQKKKLRKSEILNTP